MSDRIRIRVVNHDDVRVLIKHAQKAGLHLAEVMDREGVLVTDKRLLAIRADAFSAASSLLQSLTPAQIVGRTHNVTANDVLHSVIELLENLEKEARNGIPTG